MAGRGVWRWLRPCLGNLGTRCAALCVSVHGCDLQALFIAALRLGLYLWTPDVHEMVHVVFEQTRGSKLGISST